MDSSFTPADERLLVVIRTAIREHGKGTWEDSTAIYNRLAPSHIQQALPSLMARYSIIKQQQTGYLDADAEDAQLKADVEHLLAEAVSTSKARAVSKQT